MCRLLISATLLLTALSPLAVAEYVPPPTLDDLVQADCAVIGHFVEKDGVVQFVPAKVLWGDVGVVEALRKDEDFPVRIEEDGRLTAWTWGSATGVFSGDGFCPEDAKQRAIWFFFKNRPGDLVAGPVELADGLTPLRRGVKPPPLFCLLQRLDFDLRRDAMEDLVAGRNAELLAELHRIALAPESIGRPNALDVLIETRLVDDRFWDGWTDHPDVERLCEVLKERDRGRVMRDLRKAIEAETQPARLSYLLYLAQEDADTSIRYLDHAAPEVRDRALGNLYGSLWGLAREPAKAAQLKALAERLLPLLEARRKVETSEGTLRQLGEMLEEKEGVPWALRVPATDEPPVRYSEAEERKFVVSRLTSFGGGGFVMESAGREIAEHFLADGFGQLKEAAASQDYNTWMVYDGMGYVRDPSVLAHLVARAKAMSEGDDSFPATLRAIGRQNQERSFDVLKEILETRIRNPGGFEERGAFDALGLVRDERALDLLKGVRGAVTQGSALSYVRARAAHGDPWAIQELLTALSEPSSCELLGACDVNDVIGALLLVDTPEATEAIKRRVRDAWPTRWESFDGSFEVCWSVDMQNYAGESRRTTALGEVARRDPRWLAEVALQQMASSSLSARVCGAYIFRELTGRSSDFQAEAFAAERAAPLGAVQTWWAAHKTETREQWLLSCFRERGFPMTSLDDKGSLPVLVQAMAQDSITHDLAVERISVITGKYFTQPTLECRAGTYGIGGGGYAQMDQERTTARVAGWLEARNVLPAER